MRNHVLQETFLAREHFPANFAVPLERRRGFNGSRMLDLMIDPFRDRFKRQIARTAFLGLVHDD